MKLVSRSIPVWCLGGVLWLAGCGDPAPAPAKAAPAPAKAAARMIPGRSLERGSALDCANNLKQAGVFVLIYANDHNDWLPEAPAALVGSGCPENVLRCPGGDKFEYLIAGKVRGGDRNLPVARCAKHNLVLYADGRVEAAK